MRRPFVAALVGLLAESSLAQYSATYVPGSLPDKSENGQLGTNNCGTTDSQSSMCQTGYVNSLNDFCLWAPPNPNSIVGNSEREMVSWCTSQGHGARLIPQGTITGAHYLRTPNYIQITGRGDLTALNIVAGDQGGELDPHGADGNGNPIGGLVFSGTVQQHEWHSFISYNQFCIRICKDGPEAWLWCQHVYDVMGCDWNDPGRSDPGFTSCDGDGTNLPPGIDIGTDGKRTTFSQGQPVTPPAHAAGASSNCQTIQSLGVALTNLPPTTTTTSSDVTSTISATSLISDSAASSVPITTSITSTASADTLTLTTVPTSAPTSLPTLTSSRSTAAAASTTAANSSAAKGTITGQLLAGVAAVVMIWA